MNHSGRLTIRSRSSFSLACLSWSVGLRLSPSCSSGSSCSALSSSCSSVCSSSSTCSSSVSSTLSGTCAPLVTLVSDAALSARNARAGEGLGAADFSSRLLVDGMETASGSGRGKRVKPSAALEFTHCWVEGKQGMEADPLGGWQIQELPLQEIGADPSHVATCVAHQCRVMCRELVAERVERLMRSSLTIGRSESRKPGMCVCNRVRQGADGKHVTIIKDVR